MFSRVYAGTRVQLSLILGVSLLLPTFSFFLFPTISSAAALTNISATVTDSAPSADTNYTVSYTSTSTVAAGQTIKIQFDPDGDAFNLSNLVDGDISVVGMTVVGACGGGPGDEVTQAIDNTAPDENVTFTVCTGHEVASGTISVSFENEHITNPSSEGSYVIRIGGTQTDSGDTRVAIINAVTLSASVQTSLTFSISGVASSSVVNGDAVQTSTTTTATLIPFGILQAGTAKVAAQDLTVSTNAKNGFTVTLRQNQNLTSGSGADIDMFQNGNANITPVAWSAPTGIITNENTFGHYGVTSEDADLNSDEFGTALYAGNFATSSRIVFASSGPADGATANIGTTRIGFKIQITALQEAGSDYTNQFTYVCTPSF